MHRTRHAQTRMGMGMHMSLSMHTDLSSRPQLYVSEDGEKPQDTANQEQKVSWHMTRGGLLRVELERCIGGSEKADAGRPDA